MKIGNPAILSAEAKSIYDLCAQFKTYQRLDLL